ncbi:hypothetical protein V1638_14025 [Pseudarthrobacter sp. J64]|uniref:hypothetical protein n=1 Tax=Pseudarthrobacter sp. J64 TaxID=3116485 RepID=UPI002E7FFC95|nr:hypothetical protein [Pseudarthrobacter sp. J64]MEE2570502.1 hypothetical protein [Pseudarthrobacter sp. J64]
MRRKASSGVVVPAVVLMAVLFAGCGQQGTPQATPEPTTTSVESQATAPTPSPTGTVQQQEPWTTFTTADGTLVFDVPAAWTVQDPAGELAEGGGAFAEVRNAADKPLATLRTNMATGSTCMEKYPYSVLETEELPALSQGGSVPRFIYETRGNAAQPGPADTPAAAYGITSGPLPAGDSACAIFQFFTWPPNAAMFGAFYNPENNQTPGDQSLPYLELAEKYADTPEYKDIKRMITSLRPVGDGY